MNENPTPIQEVILLCVSGPDQGKRLAVRDRDVAIGRSAQADLLSDDPDVAERHAVFKIRDQKPWFQSIGGAGVFVDGHRIVEGPIQPGYQIRIGRSFWQMVDSRSAETFSGWLDHLSGRISSAAGIEKVQGFSFSDTFSEVFKKRTDEEVEEYFNVGTRTTTPNLLAVDTSWPKPWVFFKLFTFSVIVYLGFVFALNEFRNPILVPGLISIGSFLIPFSILVLFYEINVVRNVPLYQVIRLLLLGGILSLILSLFLFRATNLSSWLGATSAGIIEELGKASALLLVINKLKYRWTLNGMLFGAAVGTGFASFESAGYAFIYGLQGGQDLMLEIITRRGLLSILGGHVLWTALVGAALWRVRGDQRFSGEMLQDARFLRVFALAMVLHMIWNFPMELPFYAKYVVLGFVAWVVILGFIQDGLAQIRREQDRLRGPEASVPAPPVSVA
jgi:RsiW-degrading membrane proteinase PrsW (M82 family)